MKNKTSQSGFTLIELIAVMVILGILAAVIVPRISTLTSGAYESNVRSMFGVIKNEVNAQAIKAAMTGGASGHLETYPTVEVATENTYLVEWIEEYEGDYWNQKNYDEEYENANHSTGAGAGASQDIDAIIFWYMPHGLRTGQTNSITNADGVSINVEDIYFIMYAPHTTAGGKTVGRNYDGFTLQAFKDNTAAGDLGVWDGIAVEERIVDLNWTTPN